MLGGPARGRDAALLLDPRAGGPRQVTRLRVSGQVFAKSATLQREEAERLERRAAERAQWESPDWMLEKLKLKAKGECRTPGNS